MLPQAKAALGKSCCAFSRSTSEKANNSSMPKAFKEMNVQVSPVRSSL
jgi:hypothetical protein